MALKKDFQIEGIDQVINNLNREVSQIKGRSIKGLINAVILLRRKIDTEEPKVPVDTGNLRGSWFTVTARSQKGGGEFGIPGEAGELARQIKHPIIVFGFSAGYAAAVHEMLKSKKGKPINWNREGSGAKFLEIHLSRNQNEMLQEIKNSVEF